MKITSHTWRRSMPRTSFGVSAAAEAFRAPGGLDLLPAAVGFRLIMSFSDQRPRIIRAPRIRSVTTFHHPVSLRESPNGGVDPVLHDLGHRARPDLQGPSIGGQRLGAVAQRS